MLFFHDLFLGDDRCCHNCFVRGEFFNGGEIKVYCLECLEEVNLLTLDWHKTHQLRSVYAKFIGYQLGIPLYNIYGTHKSKGSTVDANALISFGIDVPPTPTIENWQLEKVA